MIHSKKEVNEWLFEAFGLTCSSSIPAPFWPCPLDSHLWMDRSNSIVRYSQSSVDLKVKIQEDRFVFEIFVIIFI